MSLQGEGMRSTRRPVTIALIAFVFLSFTPKNAQSDAIRLNWIVDGPLLGAGIVYAGIGELLLPRLTPPWGPLGAPDISQVNLLDRSAMFSYSHPLDLASTILELSAAGLPAVFTLIVDPGDFIPLAVVYGEAISLAVGTKNLLNYLIPRYRPYMYEGGAPGVDSLEDDRSFPSGHTTVVFAAATAGVTLFAMYAPDSPYFIPYTVISYSLAAATASFRVLSGMHFTTDVITGAVLGSLFGFLVPYFHEKVSTQQTSSGFRVDVRGDGVLLGYSY